MVSPKFFESSSTLTASGATDRTFFDLSDIHGDIQSRDFPVLISKNVVAQCVLSESSGGGSGEFNLTAFFPSSLAGDAHLWVEVLNTAYITLRYPNTGWETTLWKRYVQSDPFGDDATGVLASYTAKFVLDSSAWAVDTFPLEITFHKAT
jgi:hypothetical protein